MIIKNFIKALAKREGYFINRIRLTPKNRSVYEITGELNCLLSLHYISHPPYRWGVTANVVEKLRKQSKPWAVVLFFDSHEKGYLLNSTDVIYYTKKVWPLADDGDYKPAAPGSYLAKNTPFNSLDEFIIQLSAFLGQNTNIESIIENAIEEANQLRKKSITESEQHLQLKKYVSDHPETIGLERPISVTIEYSYPTGDRVDVAFEATNNNWTVVEVELYGLTQTLIGLFQAVKYRALQQAILVSKNLEGTVEGVLVAETIPSKVKYIAKLLGIKFFEIEL